MLDHLESALVRFVAIDARCLQLVFYLALVHVGQQYVERSVAHVEVRDGSDAVAGREAPPELLLCEDAVARLVLDLQVLQEEARVRCLELGERSVEVFYKEFSEVIFVFVLPFLLL